MLRPPRTTSAKRQGRKSSTGKPPHRSPTPSQSPICSGRRTNHLLPRPLLSLQDGQSTPRRPATRTTTTPRRSSRPTHGPASYPHSLRPNTLLHTSPGRRLQTPKSPTHTSPSSDRSRNRTASAVGAGRPVEDRLRSRRISRRGKRLYRGMSRGLLCIPSTRDASSTTLPRMRATGAYQRS